MGEDLEKLGLPKVDGRRNNGCKPGDNRGGGHKVPIEKLREIAKAEAYDIMKAEFWVRLAQEKAIPKLQQLIDCGKSDVEMKAAKEILDRAMGKPKEFTEISGKTELLIDV